VTLLVARSGSLRTPLANIFSTTLLVVVLLLGNEPVALAAGGRPPAGGSGIPWGRDYGEALKKAKAAKTPVLIDFWAEWCHYCHELDRTTYADARVLGLALNFVPVTVDTEGKAKDRALADRYDVRELPTILVVTPEGRSVLRVEGFQAADPFVATLEKARVAADELMSLEARLAANPKDAQGLASLGFHLFGQSDPEGSLELLSQAVPLDGQSPADDRKRTRLVVAILEARKKRFEKAEAAFSDARSLAPVGHLAPRLLLDLENAFLTGRKIQEAQRVLDETLSCCADSPQAAEARDLIATARAAKK
jgi:thiol-disulfide isomerase/thioredoxin